MVGWLGAEQGPEFQAPSSQPKALAFTLTSPALYDPSIHPSIHCPSIQKYIKYLLSALHHLGLSDGEFTVGPPICDPGLPQLIHLPFCQTNILSSRPARARPCPKPQFQRAKLLLVSAFWLLMAPLPGMPPRLTIYPNPIPPLRSMKELHPPQSIFSPPGPS